MKYRLVLLVILLITTLGFSVQAQEFPEERTHLATQLDGFETDIKQVVDDWSVPGLAIAIVTDSSVIWSKGFGERNIKEGTPVTDQTLFAIGSTTKAFTAAGLGILHDEGQIEWSKPVREYLPQFKMQSEFATEEMTPIDLLTHRSGLPRHDFLWYATDYSRESLIHRLRHLEPSASFRSTFQYQNLMYMTGGYLAGQVSGSSWEEFTRQRLLEPLGMKRSTFSVETMQETDDYAQPYVGGRDSIRLIDYRNIDAIGPAGSINSSVSEMANWVQLFLNNGNHDGIQLIDSATIAELKRPRVVQEEAVRFMPKKSQSSRLYALGWFIDNYEGNQLYWHSGAIDGFKAKVGMLPDKKIGWVILTNKGGTPVPTILMYELVDRIIGKDGQNWNKRLAKYEKQQQAQFDSVKADMMGARQEITTNADPSHKLEDYVAEYSNPGYGTFEVTMDGDSLVGQYGTFRSTLRHDKYGAYTFHPDFGGVELTMKVQFEMGRDGTINEVSIPLELAVDPIVFTRTVGKRLKNASYLKQFTGEYILKDQKITVRLKAENTLTLTIPGHPTYTLSPTEENAFDIQDQSDFSITFREEDGTITQMILHQPNGTFVAEKK